MSGFEIADRLRATQGEALPPLVALTANLIRDKAEYERHGMLEVIGKPLAVENLAQCLERLFVVCPTPERQEDPGQDVLDLPFLEEYADMVGKSVLCSAVELFERMMPNYMAVLTSNLVARDQGGMVAEAHKIKSAAGAIGLKRLHQLAQQAQNPELV